MSLHAEDRDESVDPGTDFYRFANGGWIDAHEIPPGYGSWGSFEEIAVRNEAVLHAELVRAAESPVDELERMLGDLYATGMDLDAVEAAGTDPIRPLLDAVAEVGSVADLLSLLPELHRSGIAVLWAPGVTVDHDDSTRYLLWLVPAGLGLPDRESYLAHSEAAVALRAAYEEHVGRQLVNAGYPPAEAAALATQVLAFETRLAEPQLAAEERRDRGRTLNRLVLDELVATAPGLDPLGYLDALGARGISSVNVSEPGYLAVLREVLDATEVEVLRAYAAFHVVHATADALHAAVADEEFEFYGRRIRGLQQPQERYKRVVAAVGSDMGEALSQLFVRAAFSEAAKQRALDMVEEILEEMRRSLTSRDWMSEQTRARGLEKLASFGVKIGYPDRWRDWSGLEVDRSSYAANRLAAARFEMARQLGKLTEPVDRSEWDMAPHVVNAYYHPTRNEIVFPAGILQEPMFDPDADDAVNYGGIGTVIAHEVTHGFDDQGRRFDASGHFVDWWTAQDEAHFTALADLLVEQFDGYVAVGDMTVNGRLTLGENIADLGGIALASRAHARVSEGQPAVDGLTPAQRFFLANASVWRARISEELARTLAQVDPHAPRPWRVRGPLSNSDAFQEAFGLPDDAPALRPRERRIVIW